MRRLGEGARSGGLSGPQRSRGGADQVVAGLAVEREAREPGGERGSPVTGHRTTSDRLDDPLRDGVALLAWRDDDELVPAPAGDGVDVSDRLADHGGDLAEHVIAGGPPVGCR